MKMTETIKDVMETLIEYANGGVSGLYPPEDDIQELVDYILDLQEEIEILNKDNGDITKLFAKEREETKRLHSIIKEAREYIEENQEEHKYTDRGGFTYTEGHFLRDSDSLLEILDKVEENK